MFVIIFNRYEDHVPSHPALIELNWEHNHNLNTAAVLQFRDVGEKTKDIFIDLFEKGHTPASALKQYKSSIQLTSGEDYVNIAADRNVVPDANSVYRLVFFVNIEKTKSDKNFIHCVLPSGQNKNKAQNTYFLR